MPTCRACGGVLGRDCFNESDCLEIANNNSMYLANTEHAYDAANRFIQLIMDNGWKLTSAEQTKLTNAYINSVMREFN